MGARGNVDIQTIVLSSETRLAEVLIDSYTLSAERNVAELVASRIPTDGAEVKIRVFDPTVTFKTSTREDDVEFPDMAPTRTLTVAPTFKHAGLRMGVSQLADMGGEGAARMEAWGSAVGAAAGSHTSNRAISILKSNPVAAWDSLNLFGTTHPTGYKGGTFANDFVQANLYTGTLDQANTSLGTVLSKINSIPTSAGFATQFRRLFWLVPSAFEWRARQLTAAQILPASNGTMDNTVNAGYGIQVVVVPEMGSAFTGTNADDTTSYICCEPVSGYGGLLLVDREGLTVTFHNPASSAELARKNSLEYIARFRNEVLAGRASHIHRITAS